MKGRSAAEVLLGACVVIFAGMPAVLAPATAGRLFSRALARHPEDLWVLGGALLGAIAYALARRTQRGRFVDTLQHELTHTMAALLLGASPTAVAAKTNEGVTSYRLSGPLAAVRSFLIGISPYWLSPIVLPPLLLAGLVRPRGAWLGVVAAFVGVGLTAPLTQIDPRQSDLRRHVVVVAIAAALWLWTATTVVSLIVLRSASWLQGARAWPAAFARFAQLLR